MSKSIVYFTKDISPEGIKRLYERLGAKLEGNVAAKVHSGEEGNQNFIPISYFAPIVEELHATIVETNTAYESPRYQTDTHYALLKEHGFDIFPIEILDEKKPDLVLPVEHGLQLDKNYVGQGFEHYDSMIVLSHFKGHPMGGYGGALKQLSIGCASGEGKAYIHSGGVTVDRELCWKEGKGQVAFLEAMVDAAKSVIDYFKKKGGIAYVNVMKNMSVDCDCCAVAEDPCLKDMGVLVSTDPVAIDQACLDLVYASDDPGKAHFVERVESRNGVHTIEAAAELGIGSREYELVTVE